MIAHRKTSGCKDMSMQWEIVIGLEVHTQLSTRSKIFSGASTTFGAEPNTQADAVSIALPGVLPVLNKGAVERAIRFGLAVGAHIAPRSVFARKNYFYPDLPKGYQISQFDLPVVGQGVLTRASGGRRRQVAARGSPRDDRHRPESRRNTVAGNRFRA
jgi:aspartyl-tRNA(Asn)/glutamyl-tRNA(Gln) amidotransferase subunit B